MSTALLVVVLTGGRLTELTRLQLHAPWLLFVGLGLQIALEFVDLPKDQIESVGYAFLMTSYAFVLAFCLANLTTRGIGIIAIGIAMNMVVIGLNRGMPTIPIGNDAHGERIQKPVELTIKHRPEHHDDLLKILDDRILLPEPFDEVLSFGDLVMAVGICELAYFASRRRHRRGTRQAQARSASTRSSAPSTRPS